MVETRDKRLRTPAAILEAAAHVLAESADASMAEIAAATGVGRATLYRYFPTREALLEALADEAIAELAARIEDAGLEHATVPEALERLMRAFLAVGDRYTVLLREHVKPKPAAVEARIGAPIAAVFRRGIDEGTLRGDADPELLSRAFAGSVLAAAKCGLPREVGVDQAAATIVSLFLDGARSR